ncbi:MAG: hypothetical protein H6Q43_875, partial [Deltaproteobacteria bacterium]|nr:hypothetical protein [Deltaproteobacteria bacterium]
MNRGETKKEEVIRQYIQAYNDFDVDSMLAMLHSD